MSSYDELIAEAARTGVQLSLPKETSVKARSQQFADTVFHTPIIALAILVVASSEKNFYTSELSRWSSNVLAQLCYGTTRAAGKLEWSIVLHARCAEALVFLENAGLVDVSSDDRRIHIAQAGRDFLRSGLKDEEHLSRLLRDMLKAHAFVRARGFTLL
jgi:hypothetical protein